MARTIRILSIDGGGIRGLIPATVIERLEARLDRPVSECFHLIAGTSTGGILAAGLSAPAEGGGPRMSGADLVRLYFDEGRRIFHRSLWQGFSSLGGTTDEKYAADGLEAVLEERLGDLDLSRALRDLLVTSYDIEHRRPHFFKSWKARGERLREGETAASRDYRLRDVCRATSAAPTYFEPARIRDHAGGIHALVDGGVFANNPAMCAMASARVLYPDATRFLLVSLGTGELERPIPYEDARDWGLLGWARPLLNVIFDGVSDTVDYQLRQELESDYFRFQVDLRPRPGEEDAPNDDMDDASRDNLRRLRGRAEEMLEDQAADFTRLIRRLRRATA